MRIDSLELAAFGPFTDVSLPLGKKGEVALVYGANEAGKSTCLRGLLDLFFGFPSRSPDAFLHPTNKLRIGATLSEPNAGKLEFLRRKGNKGTLLDPAGNVLEDDVLRPFLGTLDRESFAALFTLGREELLASQAQLLAGRGRVGEALFSAGTGGAAAGALGEALSAEADALFKTRGRNQKLQSLLEALRQKEAELRETALKPAQWQEIEDTYGAALRARDVARDELRQAAGALERQRRYRSASSKARRFLALRTELPDVGISSPDFASRVTAMERALGDAMVATKTVNAQRQRLDKRLAELGRSKTEGLDHLRDLVESGLSLSGRNERAQDLVAKARRAVESKRQALPETRSIEEHVLRAALDEIDDAGDLDAQWREASGEADEAERRAQSALAALRPIFAGSLEDVESVAVPSGATIDRHARALETIDDTARGQDQERARTDSELADARQRVAEFEAGRDLPSAEKLKHARAQRDSTWSAMRESGTVAGHADAFEAESATADAVADALSREADRVAQTEVARAQVTALAGRLEAFDTRRAETARQRADALAAWESEWVNALPNPPLPPAEMRDWLARRDEVLREIDAHASSRSRADQIRHRALELAEQAAAALDVEPARLRILVTQAREARDQLQAEKTARAQLREREDDLAEAEAEAKSANEALVAWEARWANAIEGSPLAPDIDLEEAKATIQQLSEAASARHQIEAQRSEAEDEAAKHQAEREECEASQAKLMTEVGVTDASLLPAAAELAGLAADLDAQRANEAFDEFTTGAAKLDPDLAAATIADLERDHADRETVREQAESDLAGAGARRQELDGSDRAALVAEEIAQLEAEVAQVAGEWLRTKTALELLGRAVESYRQANQGAVLERASSHFGRLTLGSFSGLDVDYAGGDEPVLVGTRGDDGPAVNVAGMSEGTRDQLYLALRLAALEEHARASGPMPLIVDDLFITFDDRRSAAVLEILAELATTLQVIVFTHHAHLVELARQTLGEKRLHIGNLPES